MQTSAPAKEIWQSFLTCTLSLKAAGYLSLCHCVYVEACVCACTNTHAQNQIVWVLWLHIQSTTLFLGALVYFNVPVHLHSWKVLRPAFFGSTVGKGGPGALGWMDATHPLLCFCCAVLKEMKPHNRRLSAGLVGEPHYDLGEQEQVASRGNHRSSASPADRNSHGAQKSGRTCCAQMSLRNFL